MQGYITEAEPKAYADGVPVHCAHDLIVNVALLKPNPKNPNTHPDRQIQLLGKIIRSTGWRQPITVSKRSGFIVKGHGRLAAALLEGFEEVPVDYQNYTSEAEEYADLVADNRIAELAEIDNKMLADIFAEIDTGEIPVELTGFTEDEVENLITGLSEALHDELTEPDDVPEAPEPERVLTQAGDLWLLGSHRLICGDSTDRQTVEKLMDGQKADLVFTDPPYGMKKEAEGVLNDNLNYDDLLVFNKKWIPLTFEALKNNGSWYCWGIDEPLMDIYSHILKPMQQENKITFRNLLTWNKGNGQGQLSADFRMYPVADEKCLFVMAGVQGFSNNADNYFEAWDSIREYLKKERDGMGWKNADMKRMVGHSETSGCHWFDKSQWIFPTEEEYKTWQKAAKGRAFKKEYEELKKEYYSTRAFFDNTHDNMNNVWHFDRTAAGERELAGGHATPKPIALCARAIKSSSREGETVLDVFGGSGSTLIACEQVRRACRMVELDPAWCDVIVRRYIKTTGKKDVRLIRQGKEVGREYFERMFTE